MRAKPMPEGWLLLKALPGEEIVGALTVLLNERRMVPELGLRLLNLA